MPLSDERIDITKIKPVNGIPIQGVLTMEPDQIPRLMDADEAIRDAKLSLRELTFDFIKSFDPNKIQKNLDASFHSDIRVQALELVYESVKKALKDNVTEVEISKNPSLIKIRSMSISIPDNNSNSLSISWNYRDENLANYVMSIIDKILPDEK